MPCSCVFSTAISPLITGWMESSNSSVLSSTKTLPWMGVFSTEPFTVRTPNSFPSPCKSTPLALTVVTVCDWIPVPLAWVIPALSEVSITSSFAFTSALIVTAFLAVTSISPASAVTVSLIVIAPFVLVRLTSLAAVSVSSVCMFPLDFSVMSPLASAPLPIA